MKKIFLFIFLMLLALTISACNKKKEEQTSYKKEVISPLKKQENYDYKIENNFNFNDKILTKNDAIYLNLSTFTRLGTFINYERYLSFSEFYKVLEKRPIIKFYSNASINRINLKNGENTPFLSEKEAGFNVFSFEIPFSMLKRDKKGAIKIPSFDGFIIDIFYKDNNGHEIKYPLEIKIKFFSKSNLEENLFEIELSDENIVSFNKYETKNYDLIKRGIIVLPGLLEFSEKYNELAEDLYLKNNEEASIYILNLPGHGDSTNKFYYNSIKDLRNWFSDVLSELGHKEYSVIASGESSLILYATLMNAEIQKNYWFKDLVVINPTSPNGLGFYDKNNNPYYSFKELLKDERIYKINNAINCKDYDFFNNMIETNSYYKSLDIDKKEAYLSKIISVDGYPNLVHAFNNINLFKSDYSNGYEILEEKKMKDYVYSPDFTNKTFDWIKKNTKGLKEVSNTYEYKGNLIKKEEALKRYNKYVEEKESIIKSFNEVKNSHLGFRRKIYKSFTYHDLCFELGIKDIPAWNDFIPFTTYSYIQKIIAYYDEDYFYNNLNTYFDIGNGMIYNYVISNYKSSDMNFYKDISNVVSNYKESLNDYTDASFSPSNMFLMFKDLITIIKGKFTYSEYMDLLCCGRFKGYFDMSSYTNNYDIEYSKMQSEFIDNNFNVWSSSLLTDYIFGGVIPDKPKRLPLDFIKITYMFLELYKKKDKYDHSDDIKRVLFWNNMKYFYFDEAFNERSITDIKNKVIPTEEIIKSRRKAQEKFFNVYNNISYDEYYECLRECLKNPNKLEEDLVKIDSNYNNVFNE